MVKTRSKSASASASASSREEEVDRISRLPDSIIHHILSFADTKFAVQTSLLSKRWIRIWKSLPFLKFDRSMFSKTNVFVDFVDMVFIFRDHNTDIQSLSVDWENSAPPDTVIVTVNRWILHAVNHHVEELSICITQRNSAENGIPRELTALLTRLHNSVAYRIPHHLLNCESLRKLVLRVLFPAGYLDIILPRSMNLPKLRVLRFAGLSISDVESSERLFSSCPVLEELEMTDCNIQTDGRRNLIVGSIRLKKFAYVSYRGRSMPNMIQLCAPDLESFVFASPWTQDYSLEISSPLLRVCFLLVLEENEADTFMKLPSREKAKYAKRAIKFLVAVSMVKSMTLSTGFLEVLSQAPGILDCEAPRLCNLQSLVVDMWCTRGCLRAIAYLLMISPKITQLELVSEESINVSEVGDDWETGLSSPGMMSHLESVQILEVEGCDAELKLLRFLLKSAQVLKKVTLSFRSSVPSRIKEQFKRKLRGRAVPKASSGIKMVFN